MNGAVGDLIVIELELGLDLFQLLPDAGKLAFQGQKIVQRFGFGQKLQQPGLLGFKGGDAAFHSHILQCYILGGFAGGKDVGCALHMAHKAAEMLYGDPQGHGGVAGRVGRGAAAGTDGFTLYIAAQRSQLGIQIRQKTVQIVGFSIDRDGIDQFLGGFRHGGGICAAAVVNALTAGAALRAVVHIIYRTAGTARKDQDG